MKLKTILLFALVMVIITIPLPANAREKPPEIIVAITATEPDLRYVDVQSIKGDLGISSSGKASVFGNIFARTAEKTSVTCYLKRYVNGNWVTYKSWSNTEYLNICTVMEDYYVPSGYSYKLYVYGYAWVNGLLVDTPIYITDTVYY
ncbi:hypothetical protein [Petrocella sp. FN5]|uniref:hypothetical protein n=1 Tax=Petrocella sp. FN5 TaxID=3032002 RepID=UPI0023DBD4A5|nr:hypothetical protein [Petrocella sp. FN5]MDF1618627.1 hypothetical protein [Petrocella sp. FN5]